MIVLCVLIWQRYFVVSPVSPHKFQKLEEPNGKLKRDSPEQKHDKFYSFYVFHMSETYRKWKSKLYRKVYLQYNTDAERMDHLPDNMPECMKQELLKEYKKPEWKVLIKFLL